MEFFFKSKHICAGKDSCIRCINGCAIGAIFFGKDCDHKHHRGFAVHNRAALSLETRGWVPVRSDTREFQLRVCTICNQNFNKDDVLIPLVEQRFEVLYVTPKADARPLDVLVMSA